ncbi:MAG: ThuA domain-containing protein, partial [Tepidisphaeraceae bacterium]
DNYQQDDSPLPAASAKAFEEYIAGGGGLVAIHAAVLTWGKWTEFHRMLGMSWGSPKSGYALVYDDAGQLKRIPPGEGAGSAHGANHEYLVVSRAPDHPILNDLPTKWLHNYDELYHGMRGPAENVHVLATAFSDPATRGTGLHEPMLYTIDYGKGRVVVNVMGDNAGKMQCVGFRTLVARSCEWAATGKVTLPAPDNFPTEKTVSQQTVASLPSGKIVRLVGKDVQDAAKTPGGLGVTAVIEKPEGLQVAEVLVGSPAQKSGLIAAFRRSAGQRESQFHGPVTYAMLHVDADGADVIAAVDGQSVRTAEELARHLAQPSKNGLRLLTVQRGGKETQVKMMTPKQEK